MVEIITNLPVWQSIRILGITAYILLFFGVSLGMLYSMPIWKGKAKATLYKVHSYATITGTFSAILHAMLLIVDTYMPFSWKEVLVPFAAENDPLWNGLGSLALYGTLVIILTTDLRTKLNKTLWRIIHIGSYPTFVMAMIHGIEVGSDSQSPLMYLLYVSTFGILLVLLIVRMVIGRKKAGAYLADRG
ncbi:UNVERIFIED_CONTAM: sulfoxide reductase heme-binding subunit YedZ [Brevibacillus sp. OAP136]